MIRSNDYDSFNFYYKTMKRQAKSPDVIIDIEDVGVWFTTNTRASVTMHDGDLDIDFPADGGFFA